jgi:hypothetical protein
MVLLLPLFTGILGKVVQVESVALHIPHALFMLCSGSNVVLVGLQEKLYTSLLETSYYDKHLIEALYFNP